MAEEKKTVLLNGGREVNVTLVTKAEDFLTQLLGGVPTKSGLTTLRVVKNTAGKPFVAVLIAGKHAGFLADSDAQDLFSTLADCEQNGVVAQAKGTVTAAPDGTAKPVMRLSLAEPDQLLGSMKTEVSPLPVEVPAEQSMPDQYCRSCGKGLPADAKFCLECGTPAVAVPVPAAKATVPTEAVVPVTPSVAPLPGPVAPRAQFSGTPTKGRGWWGRRNTLQKVGVIAGSVVVLVIVASVAVTAGDKDKEAVVSSATTVATPTTAASVEATTATTSAQAATTEAMASTTEAPTTTALSDFYTTYTGTGSKILNLGASPSDVNFILHLTTKATAEVKMFDASGDEMLNLGGSSFSLGSYVESYDGRVLSVPEIAKIQINTEGAWTLEVQPLSAATQLNTPGTVKGNSDDVIELTGKPSSLSISGDPEDKGGFFVVRYLQEGDFFGSELVFEHGKYEGIAVVAGDGWVTVEAGAPWTISSEK